MNNIPTHGQFETGALAANIGLHVSQKQALAMRNESEGEMQMRMNAKPQWA
jgi:hypothetical protein